MRDRLQSRQTLQPFRHKAVLVVVPPSAGNSLVVVSYAWRLAKIFKLKLLGDFLNDRLLCC